MAEEKVTISYWGAKMKSGAQVSVGFRTDDDTDDSYWFEFISDEDGHKTRMRLSREAFETVIGMKETVDLRRNVKSEMQWTFVTEASLPVDASDHVAV